MELNKAKCDAWCDLLIGITNLKKDLTEQERQYICAKYATAIGTLKVEELKKDLGRSFSHDN